MGKYKIIKTQKEFVVWKMKDFGNGYALEPFRRFFQTKEEAQDFITQDRKKEKEGAYNDVSRKNGRDQAEKYRTEDPKRAGKDGDPEKDENQLSSGS